MARDDDGINAFMVGLIFAACTKVGIVRFWIEVAVIEYDKRIHVERSKTSENLVLADCDLYVSKAKGPFKLCVRFCAYSQ